MDCNRKRGMKRGQMPASRAAADGTPAASNRRVAQPERPRGPAAEAAGWRMPAEWEPHAATWIAWPHERSDWPGKFATIPWVYTEIVRHLHTSETVHLLVNDAN